ncbi:PDR/VanB family oxidoreductase [Neobacillus citreus]|uniref:Oxidoreductase n=1 Tax=Neobacillus citreus TaxID=2833578 RepID=A0A942YEH7_9BACI|nr:PDR/VanB family oxidoreductase [Neobacillus citreus]MCH6269254.1 PDR/VanB family oxidoreductase [Neobacillus citreus]
MSAGALEVVVEEIKIESPQVKSFTLKAVNGSSLPRSSGGSHITTRIRHDKGLIERHYSLTNDPDDTDSYKIAIRRSDESKGGSVYWHDSIKTGDKLEISYPKNHFSLSFKARHHVFIAAGIGITPFLAMAAELKKKSKSFELHYASPSKELCAFYPFLLSNYSDETYFYFSREGRKMTTELMKEQPIGTHVYFCGPETMVRQYSEAAKAYGYPEKSIHFELFTPPDMGPMHPFDVKLNKSNMVLQVPEGENLLDVLLKHNIDAPYSCKIGGCGTCQIDVLEGEVDHRDIFLTDKEKQEKNVILCCISRAKKGPLVLDL